MGRMFGLVVMALAVFGLHYGVKRIAATVATAQSDGHQIPPFPVTRPTAAVTFDGAQLRQDLDQRIRQIGDNVSRAAAEGGALQIDRLNRAAAGAVPHYSAMPGH